MTITGTTEAPTSTTEAPTGTGTDATMTDGTSSTTDVTSSTTDPGTSTGPGPACGDGVMDADEECDDGNQDDTDACTSACKNAVCGDGFAQAGTEECDDGNPDDTDTCTSACKNAVCGDGFVGPGEACDDGNQVDDDACTNACAAASCGDGKLQPGEECDDANPDDTDACLSTCKNAICGDMAVQAVVEACDDGNADETDMCTTMCQLPKCGDGFIQMSNMETCDDKAETKTCDVDCTAATCGDKVLNKAAGEVCDDGNMVNTDACVGMCVVAKCGDMFVQAGVETCDDGNMIQTDACINTCQTAKCGDGQVQAGVEQCDDGNMVDNDMCSNTCKAPVASLGKIYLTSSNGTAGFYGYTIANNTWATLTSPPNVTYSQITNDGTSVYLLGNNNVIYKYNQANNSWSVDPTPGPNAEAASPIGFFKWTNQGFYYLKDGGTNLRHYKNGAWSVVVLPVAGSSAGSWDKVKNELYIRTYGQLGFRVINTLNDATARTIVDVTGVGENSRTGSYVNGFYYGRTFTGTLQKLDAVSGVKTDTLKQPGSDHMGSDADNATGFVYLSGYGGTPTVFQRYDPVQNVITSLANQPSVSNHSTITVMNAP